MGNNGRYKYDIHLVWNITNKCNLHCDYCLSESEMSHRVDMINIEKACHTLDKTGKIYEINLVGGEPSIIPNFSQFCHDLTQKHYLFLTTNLLNHDTFVEFAKKVPPEKVSGIDASVHIEQREIRSSIEDFAKTFKMLKEAGFNIFTNYVAHPRTLYRFSDDCIRFKKLGVEIKATPYIGEWENKLYPEAYTLEERGLIYGNENHAGKWEASVDCYAEKENVSKSNVKLCNAGHNVFWVEQNGNVSRCSTFWYEEYGNIYDTLKLPDETMRECTSSTCPCPYYSVLPELFERAKRPVPLEI